MTEPSSSSNSHAAPSQTASQPTSTPSMMPEPTQSVAWTSVPAGFSLEGIDDDHEEESPYKLEYARSGRSKCKGVRPCTVTPIEPDELRLGVWVEFGDKGAGFQWRHWRCVTTKQIENMHQVYDYVFEIEGFYDLDSEDRHMVERAFKHFQTDLKTTVDLDDAGTVESDMTVKCEVQTPAPSAAPTQTPITVVRRRRVEITSTQNTGAETNPIQETPTQICGGALPPQTPSSPVKPNTKAKAKIKAVPVAEDTDPAQTTLFASTSKADDDDMAEVKVEE
ncbi:BQ2448_624 [Microbotryum intermedium]|uniref:BQ2448_624 protein n=1 Tax=Microbotryum intermedium TaxID=269621 RepID=A0A238F915_9BASI|nr:BQ2448_624 [Microbotryum intermedium]